MNPEDVTQILDDVTSRLAPASEAAWNVMIAEVQISSVFALFFGILMVFLSLVAYFMFWRFSNEYSTDDRFFSRIFTGMFAFFMVGTGFFIIYNGVVGLLIPEFHLLNRFLAILQGG